jgi:hypothetical protein
MDVANAPERHRYEARIDGELAGIAQYRESDGLVTFVHTEVMSGFEGKGVGSRLVRGALEDVRARGLKVRAECEFVKGYLEKHPGDYDDLLAP